MSDQDFTTTLVFDDASTADAYVAINDVASWWSGSVDGDPTVEGGEFVYRYGDVHHSVQQIAELVPNERVVWRVVEADLPAVEPADEWTGTKIRFDLTERADGGSEVRFTHVGLAPSCSCYDRCASGWTALMDNLERRITTGQPQPDAFATTA